MRTTLSSLVRFSFFLTFLASLALFALAPAPVQADCEPAWNVVSSPNGSGDDNALSDVAVINANDIWAVGRTGSGLSPLNTLAEHWNGSGWSVVPSPNGSFSANYLISVSALASDDVWAVGYSFNNSVSNPQSHTLILHWNGTAWSVVPSPNTANPENRLHGVVAISANNVWAVGTSTNPSVYETLILHWNGTTWSIVPSPNPGSFANILYGVDAVSANNMWAVGTQQEFLEQTLVLHWNGTTWSTVSSPNIGPYGNNMLAVSVLSASDIWATGYHLTVVGFDQPYQTSVFHYDGSSWSAVPSPNVNQMNNYLFDIVGIAANDAWAVGFWDTGTALNSMVQHWDGTSWAIESSPNPGDYLNELTGVAAVSATDIWAVGETASGFFGVNTLVEHYSTDCPRSTPTSPMNATRTPPAGTLTPTPTKPPRGTPLPTATATPR